MTDGENGNGSVYTEALVRIQLCGKNYVWREPVIAQRKRQQAHLLRISARARRYQLSVEGVTDLQLIGLLYLEYSAEVPVEVMEFFGEFHAEIRGDCKQIWEAIRKGEFSDDDLIAEYRKVRDFILAPLAETATTEKNSSNSGSPKTPETSNPISMNV